MAGSMQLRMTERPGKLAHSKYGPAEDERAATITLPSASQAVDLMVHTSTAAQNFQEQSGAEQRKLLQLVLSGAS